jgi:predicted P-loop ATPase/GTPase
MKLSNTLMSLTVFAILALGLGARYFFGEETNWNPFKTEINAAELFKPLAEFIDQRRQESGKYPSGRDVKDVARIKIPYIMVYYSIRPDDYQIAFRDSEYAWIYDSASDTVFRLTDDISQTAWYDYSEQLLLSEKELKQHENTEYYRL